MTSPLLMAMPGNEKLAAELAAMLDYELGRVEIRQFPDGETYLRLMTSPEQRAVAIMCTLDHPDEKILPLLFCAATARELNASRVGLVAPYLAYMRQDRRFKPGEAVTSRQVAHLVSEAFDWLVTLDPHLHRYGTLGDIYSIPTRIVHAAPMVSLWIRTNVSNPLIIGPDSESEQWVAAVAKDADAPYCVLEKTRHGDRSVEIKIADLVRWQGRTPVLVDDIISTGQTMLEAIRLLRSQGWAAPVSIAVHGLFAEQADRFLAQAGAQVITSNTIVHATNRIDLTASLARAIGEIATP